MQIIFLPGVWGLGFGFGFWGLGVGGSGILGDRFNIFKNDVLRFLRYNFPVRPKVIQSMCAVLAHCSFD